MSKITVSQAARIFRWSEAKTRQAADRGLLPCERTESGVRILDREGVERVAAGRENHQPPNAPSGEAA